MFKKTDTFLIKIPFNKQPFSCRLISGFKSRKYLLDDCKIVVFVNVVFNSEDHFSLIILSWVCNATYL